MDLEWYGLRMKPQTDSVDGEDAKPAWKGPLKFTAWDSTVLILAALSVFVDVISDCYVAYIHAAYGRMVAMILTIVFIVVPGWISTCASLLLIFQDRENKVKSQWSWRYLITFHILPLVLVPRYVNSLKYGLKSQQDSRPRAEREMYYYQMLWEDYDASYLRLIEAFLEACPQLLLQAVLLLTVYQNPKEDPGYYWPHMIFPMFLSLFSMAYAVVCYKRSLRISQNSKKLSISGAATLLASQLCLISSRLIVLSLFISACPLEVIVSAFIARFLLNAVWLTLFLQFKHIKNAGESTTLRLILSFLYLFTYIDFYEGSTAKRATVHHIMTVVDCAVLISLYCTSASYWNVYCIVSAICLYPLGLMILVFYYCRCHPTSMSDGVHFIDSRAPTL